MRRSAFMPVSPPPPSPPPARAARPDQLHDLRLGRRQPGRRLRVQRPRGDAPADSVPALIARQAGVQDFQQPLDLGAGDPARAHAGDPRSRAPSSRPRPRPPGAPKNLALARPYNNLAVPGATSVDALTRTTDAGGLHDLILRGLGTQVQQAVALQPTVDHALDRQQRRAGGGRARPRHRRASPSPRRPPSGRPTPRSSPPSRRRARSSWPPTCPTSPRSRSSPPSRPRGEPGDGPARAGQRGTACPSSGPRARCPPTPS